MTEYDYSPEAWERYMATQDRIARWVDGTHREPPCNAFSPATPHLEALALKEKNRRKERRRRRDYDDDGSDASIDTEYEEQRQRRRRERHQNRLARDQKSPSRRPERSPELDDFVFVSRPPTPTQQLPMSTHSSPTKPKMSRSAQSAPIKQRKAPPPPLSLDPMPFPSNGIPPQDPYSYRNSGHSSQSSNTTPTSITPTHTNFPAHQLPFPPYSAAPIPPRAPKTTRSQTMPLQPPAYPTPPPGYHQGYAVNPITGHPIMVPLRPGMKGYTSYGPDPLKTPQLPWSEYTSSPPAKSPSLLKRMFTGLTGHKQSRSPAPQTPPIPYPQYPIFIAPSPYPQKAQYPVYSQQHYPVHSQYPQPLPPYSATPVKPRLHEKDSGTYSAGGRMQRKRSQSFNL